MKFAILPILLSLLVVPALTHSQEPPCGGQNDCGPKLIEFDAPGSTKTSSSTLLCYPSCGTQALANNAKGWVVGSYTDDGVVSHGFLRAPDGNITSFDAPTKPLPESNMDQGTFVFSINDLGLITGTVQDGDNVFHGFVRYPSGFIVTFDLQQAGTGAYQGTEPLSINLEGTIAGSYIDATNTYHGFVRSQRGEVTSFDPPSSVYTFVCEETCINPQGQITGYYEDSSGLFHGFLRDQDGEIITIDGPDAALTIAASINLEGAITGYYQDSTGYHGFLRTHDGKMTSFNVPGVGAASPPSTAAFSINTFGAITGEYLDAKGMHGFSRSPEGTFVTFDAPGAGAGPGFGTRPSTNNVEGAVAGWWVDATTLNHGFVWVPSN